MMLRVSSVLTLGLLTLGACGSGEDAAEPSATEQVQAAAATPKSDAEATAPVVLTANQLRDVCQGALAAIHGQRPEAIRVDGLEGEVVKASWPAPVDGGRNTAECRVEGDVVTWRPTNRPSPEQNRWMNQAGDPVVRFTLDGGKLSFTQAFPDGTSATVQTTAGAEQEAR